MRRSACLAAILIALLAATACGAPRSEGLVVSPAVPEDLAAVLEDMPAGSTARENEIVEHLLLRGPAVLATLTGMLGSGAADDDVVARYALASLALRASRPGADAFREAFVAHLAAELQARGRHEERRFLIELLQRSGGAESVPALESVLAEPELAEPAVRALVSIGGPDAREAIVRGLERGGASAAPALVAAAGRLGAEAAVPALRRRLGSDDPEIVEAAADALAELASPAAVPDLIAAFRLASESRRWRLGAITLRAASRLAAAGDTGLAVRLTETVLATGQEERDEAVLVAALRTLAVLDAGAAANALARLPDDLGPSDRTAAEIERLRTDVRERREE